jgi:multicomponent Na+:H+ antiporter subunit D
MRSLNEHAQTRYYFCFALTLSATIGVAFSSNLVTLYLFYEMISFVTYPLVAHKETDEAFDKGNKYVFYLLMTSKGLLLASFLSYALSGTFDFKPNGVFSSDANRTLLMITYFLFLIGVAKAAMIPFHAWLPAAMIAPTPVSALLHAVAVVNTGVFVMLRIMFHVFGVEVMQELNLGLMTAGLASFTIIVASFYAMTMDNLKLRLAYSTISQLSYMILGGALLTASGMVGGIMHIASHAFSKIVLFFCAGAIAVASQKTLVSQLSGIGRKMPWTMAAFSIGSLSIIGIPPTAGYVTKHYLETGATEANQSIIYYLLWGSALLSAGYLLPVVYKAYSQAPQGEGDREGVQPHEPSFFITIPLLLCAVVSVFLGIYPELLVQLVRQVVR